MKLEAADGTAVDPVTDFVYLGSNISRDGDATKEVRRRTGMAGAVFATLGKVWDSNIVPLKLKPGLFRSLVEFVLLYNAECWSIRTDAVEGCNYRCLRRVTRIQRGSPSPLEDHPSRAVVFGVAASPHATSWMGQCLRVRKDPLRALTTTTPSDDGPWNKLIRADMSVRNNNRDNVLALFDDDVDPSTVNSFD